MEEMAHFELETVLRKIFRLALFLQVVRLQSSKPDEKAHREYHEKLLRVVAEDEAAPPPQDEESGEISFSSLMGKTAKTEKPNAQDKIDAPFSSREPSLDMRHADLLQVEPTDKPDNAPLDTRFLPL